MHRGGLTSAEVPAPERHEVTYCGSMPPSLDRRVLFFGAPSLIVLRRNP
jgi:hypothetical protein